MYLDAGPIVIEYVIVFKYPFDPEKKELQTHKLQGSFQVGFMGCNTPLVLLMKNFHHAVF